MRPGFTRMIDVRIPEKLRDWLKGQPVQVSVAMGGRAAARVLPVLGVLSSKRSVPKAHRANIVLPIFRAVSTALTAARYPVIGAEDAAFAAAAAAAAAARAAHVAEAAAVAVNTAYGFYVADAADAAAADAAFIERGGSAAALAARPLWPEVIPGWVQENWCRLKAGLPKTEHWEVWTRWYEARRDGEQAVESVERYRALQDENFWRKSIREINAAIAEEEGRWRSLEPRPAPFDYRVVDDKIDVAPETAQSIDAGTSLDLRDECLRKARGCTRAAEQDRLMKTCAPISGCCSNA
jgi:hypothetical protein